MSKNEYTSVVLKGLLGAMSGDQAETLKQLMEVCDGERSSDSMELNIGNVTDVESVPAERTGWNNPVAVWIPKPIGA